MAQQNYISATKTLTESSAGQWNGSSVRRGVWSARLWRDYSQDPEQAVIWSAHADKAELRPVVRRRAAVAEKHLECGKYKSGGPPGVRKTHKKKNLKKKGAVGGWGNPGGLGEET